MNLQETRLRLDRLQGEKGLLEKQAKEIGSSLKTLAAEKADIDLAVTLFQTVAQETQNQLRFHIEDIVQLLINACFPEKYEFHVAFELKRGRTEARVFLEQNGTEIDPMASNGGGLVDLVAFGLRCAAWSLSKTSRIMLLDEPFKFLDKTKRPFAMQMLKELSSRLGLQIIMVTHDPEAIEAADRVFEIAMRKEGNYNVSYVKNIVNNGVQV